MVRFLSRWTLLIIIHPVLSTTTIHHAISSFTPLHSTVTLSSHSPHPPSSQSHPPLLLLPSLLVSHQRRSRRWRRRMQLPVIELINYEWLKLIKEPLFLLEHCHSSWATSFKFRAIPKTLDIHFILILPFCILKKENYLTTTMALMFRALHILWQKSLASIIRSLAVSITTNSCFNHWP